MPPKSAVANPEMISQTCRSSFDDEVEPAAARRPDSSCKRGRDIEDDFARQVRSMSLSDEERSRESSVQPSEVSECDEGTDFGWLCIEA